MIMSLNLTWERVETCLLVVMVTEYYYVINKYCQVNTYFKQGFLLHYIKIFSLKSSIRICPSCYQISNLRISLAKSRISGIRWRHLPITGLEGYGELVEVS